MYVLSVYLSVCMYDIGYVCYVMYAIYKNQNQNQKSTGR